MDTKFGLAWEFHPALNEISPFCFWNAACTKTGNEKFAYRRFEIPLSR